MSAYSDLKTALEAVKPTGWSFTPWEPLQDMPDVTGLTMKIRSVSRLPAAPVGDYRIEWLLTITSPHPSRETADPQLFDDLLTFLAALDGAEGLTWLAWTEATKTVGDDLERLAYDITLITHTARDVPTTEETP